MDEKKPGYKTTEFWLTLVALIVGALLSSGAIGEDTSLQQVIIFAASALGALGYTAGRTFVKHSEVKAAAIVAANSNLDGPSGNE